LILNDGVEVDDEAAAEGDLRSAPEVAGEVLSGVSRRREWSTDEKLRILAQSVAPGSSPTLTCRMYGISSGQLYTWRKQFRSGALTGFVPVSIASEAPTLPAPVPREPPVAAPPSLATGVIEVELPSGVKLRIAGDVCEVALRRIFSALS
jgi:transposase